jgi:serine/threonine protein kinase
LRYGIPFGEERLEMASVISVGDWIGNRFEVFDIHEGGMSLVYIVNDHLGSTGRKALAIKTLREELLRSKVRIGRFAAECRIWTQLGDHPNIVRAHSVEIIDKRPYVVLELVRGGDLSRWIGSARLDLPRVLSFGLQFCRGMDHALRQGLHCHRDIKPANLMVTEDGQLKITDFGLARVCEELVAVRAELPDGSIPLAEPSVRQPIVWADPRDRLEKVGMVTAETDRSAAAIDLRELGSRTGDAPRQRLRLDVPPAAISPQGKAFDLIEPNSPFIIESLPGHYEPDDTPYDPRLTRIGARLGTGAYMAPEQFIDPKSVDVRADIYAFGNVLFEMITGELPFSGRSHAELERQHARRKPASVVPSIAGRFSKHASSVDAIVHKCLEKDPVKRFRTISELRIALKAVFGRITRK